MSNNDIKFIDGLSFKAPHENAPDWVIAKISIKREDLIAWLQSQPGEWINADLKESQGGKLYAAVDEWKPNGQRQEGGGSSGARGGAQNRERPQRAGQEARDAVESDDIPFIKVRSTF